MFVIEQKNEISLWRAWAVYLAAWFIGYWMIGLYAWYGHKNGLSSDFMFWRFLAIHLVYNVIVGVCLTRYLLPRLGLDWHPLHNTVGEVSSFKLSAVFFWWIFWPVLFVRLFAAKYF